MENANGVSAGKGPALANMKSIQKAVVVMLAILLLGGRQEGVAAGSPDVTVVTQPISQDVPAGATVIFAVVAASPGTITYQWVHAGTIIPNATSATLVLTNVQFADAGDYLVQVHASGKKVDSASANLTVDGVSLFDVVGPKLKVTDPSGVTSRSLVEQITFSGTASDDTGVAGVCYKHGANPWVDLGTGTNWSFDVTLQPGTNVFQIKAADIVGNYSATQRVVVFYSVPLPLNLNVVGAGTVAGATNGQLLELGKNYTLQATPAAGVYFDHWDVDGEVSTNLALTFFMWSNRTVTATFVGNPFVALKGTYTALFYDQVVPVHESSGIMNFKVTDQGLFTGRLIIAGETVPFLGRFDMGLNARVVANRDLPNGPVTVELQLARSSDEVTGSVSGEGFTSSLVGYRSTFHATTNPATEFTGKFTLAFSGGTNGMEAPEGLGYALVSVTSAGVVQLKGVLADGVAATQKRALASNGQWPVYLALYRGGGSVVGWLTIADDGVNDLSGRVLWTRPAGFSTIFYPLGFASEVEVKGSRYTAPETGVPAVALSTPVVYLAGGNLDGPITADVTLDAFNKLTFAAGETNKLALKVTASSGLLSGSFYNSRTLRKSTLRGVLLQRHNLGSGFFLGTNQSGVFFLGAPESFPVFP